MRPETTPAKLAVLFSAFRKSDQKYSGCRRWKRASDEFTPTVLEILRIPAPKHVSGRSLSAAWQGETTGSRDCYSETETKIRDNARKWLGITLLLAMKIVDISGSVKIRP